MASGVEAHGQRTGWPGWARGGTPGDRRVGPRVPRSTHRKDRGPGGRLAIVGLVPRGGESRERARGVPKRTGDQVEVSGVNGGRRRRTAARGAHQPPFLGPWDKTPAWRCLAGREGQAQHEERG